MPACCAAVETTGAAERTPSGMSRTQNVAPVPALRATTLVPVARKTAGCGKLAPPLDATQPTERPVGGELVKNTDGVGQAALPSDSRMATTLLGLKPGCGFPAGGPKAANRRPNSG